MNDRERIEAMLERTVRYERSAENADRWTTNQTDDVVGEHSSIVVEDGYMWFFTQFNFDADGNLLGVQAWE